MSPQVEKQLKFWTDFRESILDFFPHPQKARAQYWYDVALGKSGFNISNTYNTNTNTLGCRIYINSQIAGPILEFLEPQKEDIERELGFQMIWNPYPDKKDKVIYINKQFNMDDPNEWKESVSWLKEHTIKVYKCFSKRIKGYKG